ncbi:hypothetical protein G9A89_019147 [Geosiphon pyriformis]|nr:hypothetical protein G9A89_019147 [Geosiphon pyriformis]
MKLLFILLGFTIFQKTFASNVDVALYKDESQEGQNWAMTLKTSKCVDLPDWINGNKTESCYTNGCFWAFTNQGCKGRKFRVCPRTCNFFGGLSDTVNSIRKNVRTSYSVKFTKHVHGQRKKIKRKNY